MTRCRLKVRSYSILFRAWTTLNTRRAVPHDSLRTAFGSASWCLDTIGLALPAGKAKSAEGNAEHDAAQAKLYARALPLPHPLRKHPTALITTAELVRPYHMANFQSFYLEAYSVTSVMNRYLCRVVQRGPRTR